MTQVDPLLAVLPTSAGEPTSSVDLAAAERLHQALVVHPDGTAEFTFVTRPSGEPITATQRGVVWVAHQLGDATIDNPAATSFAQEMGWDGPGVLGGTVVFVGDHAVEDVPGVLVAEAMRRWDGLQLLN